MINGIIFDLDGTLIRLPIRYEVIFEKLQNLFDTQDEFKPLIPTILEKANNDAKLIQQAFDLICEEELLPRFNCIVLIRKPSLYFFTPGRLSFCKLMDIFLL